uniref:Uncharacterized protein n=1 Tax=Triticum urartu TaxID=4572 RepID=A0A8R7PXP8_TRIUA
MKEWWTFPGVLDLITFFLGAMNDHARPHLAVCPCTNSVVFTTEAPASRTLDANSFRFAFLPTIDVNHLKEFLKETLSSIRCVIKACSPPGQAISSAVPAQEVLGLRPASSILSKKGGLHIQKSKFSLSFTTPTKIGAIDLIMLSTSRRSALPSAPSSPAAPAYEVPQDGRREEAAAARRPGRVDYGKRLNPCSDSLLQ